MASPAPPFQAAVSTHVELTRQLITLATAIVTLMITFIDKSGAKSPSLWHALSLSWLVLLASIVAGVQHLDEVAREQRQFTRPDPNPRILRWLRWQKWLFFVGLGGVVLASSLRWGLLQSSAETKTSASNQACTPMEASRQ
jgi:hypothetical protein